MVQESGAALAKSVLAKAAPLGIASRFSMMRVPNEPSFGPLPNGAFHFLGGQKMNKINIMLCLILIVTLLQGCSIDAIEPVVDDPSTATAEDDNCIEAEQQEEEEVEVVMVEEDVDKDETDYGQIPEASESEKELLFFDPSSFCFGKEYGEIKTEFVDLEYRGNLSGGEFFYASSAETFFIFPGNEINNPQEPNNSAKVTGLAFPARKLFPKMGSRIEKAVLERIFRGEITILIDDYKIPNTVFSCQGYKFSYDSEDTEDILPETIILIRIDC